MNPLDGLFHTLNFFAPALALALALPLAARLFLSPNIRPRTYLVQVAVNFLLCSVAHLISLWWWGSDGTMAAYAVLALVGSASQWLLSYGWRR